MPYALVDILEACNGNRKEAAEQCLRIATNFPEFSEEFTRYANILLRQA